MGTIESIPMFWITRKCVRYSCPNVIQKRARLIVGKLITKLSISSWWSR